MKSLRLLALLGCTLIGCKAEEPPKKRIVLTEEQRRLLQAGLSPECLANMRMVEEADRERNMRTQIDEIRAMGQLSELTPVDDELGAQRRYSRTKPKAWSPPAPTIDILARNDIRIINEFDGRFGVTEDYIRGLADQVYEKLGIFDPSIQGYILSFRPADNGAGTSVDKKTRMIVIQIAPPMLESSAAHEMAHALTGNVMVGVDSKVVHLAAEYVAISAENDSSRDPLRMFWDYDRYNTPILAMGRTIDGETGVIHASGAPLDGWRYDSLRLTDQVIGEEGQVVLAKALYDFAATNGSLTVTDFRRIVTEHGLGNLALLQEAVKPGLYLDFTIDLEGDGYVLAKTVDSDGYEGITTTPVQFVFRDNSGKGLVTTDASPMQPVMAMGGTSTLLQHTSVLEVRVAGVPYTIIMGDTEPAVTNYGTDPKVFHFATGG